MVGVGRCRVLICVLSLSTDDGELCYYEVGPSLEPALHQCRDAELIELPPAGFHTAAEVLLTTPANLAKKTTLSTTDVTSLILELSLSLDAEEPARTVADLLGLTEDDDELDAPRAACTITTGDEGMDQLLGGGVRVESITEFVGEACVPFLVYEPGLHQAHAMCLKSASGKSHICLQLATTAQLAVELGGLQGGTMLISSEGTLPSQRLFTLAESLAARLASSSPCSPWTAYDMMDNIHTAKATDAESLAALLSYYVPAHIEAVASHAASHTLLPPSSFYLEEDSPSSTPPPPRTPQKPPLPIRLVIVDSIAAPIRGAHGSDSAGFISRSKELNGVSDSLKRLAHVYCCAVVVVNQVSAVFSRPMGPNSAHESYHLPRELYNRFQSPHFSGEKSGNAAALGPSWTNSINARIMLSRTKRRTSGEPGVKEGTAVRLATLVFSPCAPRASIEFVVDEEGVRSLVGNGGQRWDEVN